MIFAIMQTLLGDILIRLVMASRVMEFEDGVSLMSSYVPTAPEGSYGAGQHHVSD